MSFKFFFPYILRASFKRLPLCLLYNSILYTMQTFFIHRSTLSQNSIHHSNLCNHTWNKRYKAKNKANKLTCHQNSEVDEVWGLIFYMINIHLHDKWMLFIYEGYKSRCALFIAKLNQITPPTLVKITVSSVQRICSRVVHRQSLN